ALPIGYLSKQKIAEDAGYKSRRTAIRACNRMEALGIIEQHETKRIKGDRRQSVNVIVINAVVANCNEEEGFSTNLEKCHSQVTADSHAIETPYKTNSSNTYKETVSSDSEITTDEIIKRGLKNSIPSEIYNVLSPHFNGQELYDIYGILLRAKAAIDRSITLEVHADKFMTVFYNVKALYKAGKVRKSLRGLLYASWERLSAEISRQEAAVAMGVM